MHRAQDSSPNDPLAQRDRRLVTGIVVSALLHGLLLSLQFGIPGVDAGPGGPIQVTLAPPAPPPATSAPSERTLPAPLPQPSVTPPRLPLAPPVAAAPAGGLRLLDPRPEPAPPAAPAQPV
ncbi:MAG: hypothetical protein ACK4S9_13780, partial [Massilia sp.]